jgi:phage terminase small subunit
MALTDKRRKAIDVYFENGFMKGEALIAAGYSKKTAKANPQSFFNREDVKVEIARRKVKLAEKHEVTQEFIIGELMKRALSGATLARFKKVQADGSLMWDFSGATEEELALVSDLGVDFIKAGRGKKSIDVTRFRIKEPDAHAALMALARHLGLFNDSLEVTGGTLADRIREGRGRLAKEGELETVH